MIWRALVSTKERSLTILGDRLFDRPIARELLALGQGVGIQTVVFVGYYDVVHETASKRDSF
jgi:hypothetical protein